MGAGTPEKTQSLAAPRQGSAAASCAAPPAAPYAAVSLPLLEVAPGVPLVVTWRFRSSNSGEPQPTHQWFGSLQKSARSFRYSAEKVDGVWRKFVDKRLGLHEKIIPWPPSAAVEVLSLVPSDIVPLDPTQADANPVPPASDASLRARAVNGLSKTDAHQRSHLAAAEATAFQRLLKSAAAALKRLKPKMQRPPGPVLPPMHKTQRQDAPTDEAPNDDALAFADDLVEPAEQPVMPFPTSIPQDSTSDVPHDTTDTAVPDDEDDPVDFSDMTLEAAAAGLRSHAAFRCANGSAPTVGAMTGADLLQLLALPSAVVPSLASDGLVKSTRLEHMRMLAKLPTLITPALSQLPLTSALVTALLRERQKRKWKWSTTVKYLATVHGATALLPLYRATPFPIRLGVCPVWNQSLRAAAQRARQELPRQPAAITWRELQPVLSSLPDTPVFVALLLGWFSAARLGCILQLSRADLTLHKETRTVDIRFRRGKGARARGPYTVCTPPIPEKLWGRFERYVESRNSWIFPTATTGSHLKEALRLAGPQFEQRSIRRGALQSLAQAPNMTDEILMLFSGHTQVRTLRRYLSWGTRATHTATHMRQAAGSALVQ